MTFERRSHIECLDELTDWIADDNVPFCSLRITDGELWSMFRYRPETDVTADGNRMDYGLGDAIRETIRGFASEIKKNPEARIQFGTTAYQHPDETTKWLMAYTYSLGIADKMRWINGHDLLDGVVDGRTKKLFQTLEQSIRPRILLGDSSISEAACCLDAPFVAIPKPNSWDHRDKILKDLKPFAKAGCTFIWCCGMGCKPLAWQLFQEFPQSSHMDAGHIFDGAFGQMSREWLRNKEDPWWSPYMEPDGFKDWVLSHIPKSN